MELFKGKGSLKGVATRPVETPASTVSGGKKNMRRNVLQIAVQLGSMCHDKS